MNKKNCTIELINKIVSIDGKKHEMQGAYPGWISLENHWKPLWKLQNSNIHILRERQYLFILRTIKNVYKIDCKHSLSCPTVSSGPD